MCTASARRSEVCRRAQTGADNTYCSGPHNSNTSPHAEGSLRKPGESPAYIMRSAHPDGAIIITGDATGCIKVFRQDCAYEKRMQWDTWSMSRKFSSTGYLCRHTSMASSKGNLTRQDSSSTSVSHDRVLSWRQSIASTSSLETANGSKRSQNIPTDPRSHRIGLFGRTGTHSPNLDSGRKSSFDISSISQTNVSPTVSLSKTEDRTMMPRPPPPPRPPRVNPDIVIETTYQEQISKDTAHSTDVDVIVPDESRPQLDTRTSSTNSNMYWRTDAWRDQTVAQLQESNSQHTGDKSETYRGGMLWPLSRQASAVSRLTDEASSNA